MNDNLDRAAPKERAKYFWRALGYFIALALVNTLAYSVIGRSLKPLTSPWLRMLLENMAYLVGVVGLTWAFCHFIDRSSLRDLGMQRRNWFGKVAAGLALGLFLQLLILLAFAIAGWLSVERALWQPLAFISSVISWIITSFNEELAFRGYIMQRLSRAWGIAAAVVASSLIFAMVHALNPNVQVLALISTFAAGLLLATAYLVSRSLWLPIGLHIGWNLAQMHLFGFAGAGAPEPAIWRSTVAGPEIMTGGAYGPEGGILGLVLPLIGIVILLLWYRIAPARKTQN